MKLNGLTNNLKGNDTSLSNSYLSHIVELLRQEVEAISSKENNLETVVTEHIETQEDHVDTGTVNATIVNADKVNTSNINDIIILSDAINMLANLKVNGHDVITDESFTGPFTYKGVVEELPATAQAGDVYIYNDTVYVSDGEGYNSFNIPLGTVSRVEYDADKREILNEIGTVAAAEDVLRNDFNNYTLNTNNRLDGIDGNLTDMQTAIDGKVDKNPEDDKTYVRKNDEWIEMSAADNTVKHTDGESVIDNDAENGVSITSPKVSINSEDIKVNGNSLTESNKFGLSKTVQAANNYYYEMKFGRSPYDATSSIRQMWSGYGDNYQMEQKAPPEMFTVFTKNWQYTKWGSVKEGGNDAAINITAMDKDGNINNIPSCWEDWVLDSTVYMQISCFITFNQEYVPEDYNDTVYLFNPGCTTSTTWGPTDPYLIELKNGEFSRKIDIYNGVGKLREQGFTPAQFAPDYSHYCGVMGGKGLRNKDVQRLCIVCFNVGSSGGNYAIVVGGDRNSNIHDPFDPTKAIYIPLPATAQYAYCDMAATDTAWYLMENATGRMMRITPDGQVSEINLSQAVTAAGFNYIEYTDKNNKPAAAYYVHNIASGGKHYVIFLEEGEDSQVNLIERQVTSDSVTPTADNWYAQLFKFCENSYYIFFTADCGNSPAGNTNYGVAAMKNVLWYWDKQTHTTHCITPFYAGLTFGIYDFIEMHKTRDNAIWFPYIIQDLTPANRTGELHFVSDIDYTDIDPETGVDNGEILVNTATVGTEYGFFTVGTTPEHSFTYFTHTLQGNPTWSSGGPRNQLSATNDDGILCIISGEDKCIALCYGDGNIQLYPICTGTNTGRLACDADKMPYVPDNIYLGNSWYAGHQTLYGMSHGWVLKAQANAAYDMYDYDATQEASYTYIGIQYVNDTPTILMRPHINKIQRCGNVRCAQRIKFEKYAYLQTYDDYERRKKVLSEIRAYIPYSVGQTGSDAYFKEVRKETKKLNLTYDGNIISSVDL